MLYGIYRVLSTIFIIILLPILPLICLKSRKYRYKIGQRLSRYPTLSIPRNGQKITVWIHAASVGEIQAARVLITTLMSVRSDLHFVVTTMTKQGHRVAINQLPHDTTCLLAPLDVPVIVRNALKKIRPEAYVCLETELWPAMLMEARRTGVKMTLLNARMSEKSYKNYCKLPGFIGDILKGFSSIGAISKKDADRFTGLGFDHSLVSITGNAKYDLVTSNRQSVITKYTSLLNLDNTVVFICGSTREGEEEILSRTYKKIQQHCKKELLWILAPRHLERLPQIKAYLQTHKLTFDLYSELKTNKRRHSIVIIDNMGELADLYAVGNFNFCGGSLVDKGGHNIMEAAKWDKPVYFGPSMKDFHDAVQLLEPAGAGFKITDGDSLAELIVSHMENPAVYEKACRAAARITAQHYGAARRQSEMVINLLDN